MIPGDGLLGMVGWCVCVCVCVCVWLWVSGELCVCICVLMNNLLGKMDHKFGDMGR